MGHADIDNHTPFAFALVPGLDEHGREIVATVVKGTFRLDRAGRLILAEHQAAVDLAGQTWGQLEQHGYKLEPEVAFIKLATDVVLVGHAQPAVPGASVLDVQFRVGPLEKVIRVFGDRFWYGQWSGHKISEPKAIDAIPLSYDRAQGGWDRSDPDPRKHEYEPRNPIGTGFHAKNAPFIEGAPLPNLENPRDLVREYRARNRPVGVGFVSPDWLPRSALSGTYDEAWQASRMPLLPADFDRRFFNAASEGLVARGHLHGDEAVVVTNVAGFSNASFALPGVVPPTCRLHLTRSRDHVLSTRLDTVIVHGDARQVLLIWRACLPVLNGLHDVRAVEVQSENARLASRPRPSNVIPLRAGGGR